MAYKPAPTHSKGGQQHTRVVSDDLKELLELILVELKEIKQSMNGGNNAD